MSFTPKQQRFVEEYLVDGNGTRAAIAAGYAKSGARTEAARLLANAHIAQFLAEKRAEQGERLSERTLVTKEWMSVRLAKLFDRAYEADDTTGASKVGNLLARLHGMIIEKRDLRLIRSIGDLTDDELAAIAAGSERDKSEGTRH